VQLPSYSLQRRLFVNHLQKRQQDLNAYIAKEGTIKWCFKTKSSKGSAKTAISAEIIKNDSSDTARR
jgi:outer membrane protein assembly factor BamE (lipoprotein component of BamABCDE complex)